MVSQVPMPARHTRVIVIGISGPSSGGKTTISRYLRTILPNSTIVHQDDFYKPENQLPIDPKTGLANWDCPDAIDFKAMISALTHVKEFGTFPPSFESLEDKNPVGAKEQSEPIPQSILDDLRQKIIDAWLESSVDDQTTTTTTDTNQIRDLSETKFIIVDGFMLYVNDLLRKTIDIKFYLTAPYAILKERRESRKGYATLEGYWVDPPGYFDDIVWPNYLEFNSPFIEIASLIEAEQDTGIYDDPKNNNSNNKDTEESVPARKEPMTRNIDIISSARATIQEMVERVSRLVGKRLCQLDSNVSASAPRRSVAPPPAA